MSTTSSGRQFHWHAIVITAVTIFFVWWFVKDLDLEEVGRSMARADLALLAAALVVTVHTYLIRAWRR